MHSLLAAATEAWIGLAGTVVVAILAPIVLWALGRANRKASDAQKGAEWSAAVLDKKIEDKIGTPNGKGNVIQMLEHIIEHQKTTDATLRLVDSRSEATCTLLTEHLKRYDTDHPGPLTRPPHLRNVSARGE